MADLTKVPSFQYPAAHIGHLNAQQQASLTAFKVLCEEKGYYKPKGEDGKGEPSHDDETLLRYLRARKFNAQEAYGQFKDTEDWRKENNLEELYERINVGEYEATRKLYPQWTGRRDRRGIPVYVYEVAPLNQKTLTAYEENTAKYPPPINFNATKVPTKMLRLFALYENMITFILPLCTAIKGRDHPETPISQSNNIVDISKVGLKQFWNLKAHMQDASTLATAHYPETLDRIFIIGAPAFFPTVWGWIKRWFDPITVSKIFILGANDVKPTLERYIDPANIPKKYGGQLDYEFGQMPNIEPDIAEALVWESSADENGRRTFPTGPIKWIPNEKGETEAVAVGTEDGKLRRRVVAKLAPGHTFKGFEDTPSRPIGRKTLERFETGNSTHPTTEGTPLDTEPSSSSSPGASTPAQNKEALGARIGTSETRFEQQEPTHAAGQGAEGTPAVNHHGDGDKTVSMEPGTVGQAPKDVSQPLGAQDTTQPGYVDQAKSVANQAYEGASAAAGMLAGAVGLGAADKDKEIQPQTKREDPRVDAAEDKDVEEYLRSKTQVETGGETKS
ncbi:CRAL/TRIO domain-containing protein [Pseudovirgaria hyperparasitica]|uniref:CRAL/TRIO domain-containing protein n=1 Tax=Pseudovirgaria hyperparasitica TaxID=470096 RepID=A0A6A6WEA3_9PEZI|nr:CRAL/TRIO domain-containing protein [Pseudovirgaria hyperparasitica]KAF2760865.1 CRAL/TRIO domain-containing protein [Pseudovirgaria hyperparasitica]